MRPKRQIVYISLISAAFFVLILDSKTALRGAADGINICTATVIPSLFPFLVISTLLVSRLTGSSTYALRYFGRFCGVPRGSESIFLIGLVGGYPIGAQCLRTAVERRDITLTDARRMMSFCNNAGPAFIFGIGSSLFQTQLIPLLIWGIQILSALLVSCILPGKSDNICQLSTKKPVSFIQAVEQSMKTMCMICSWVVLFRILIAIVQRWVLWILPSAVQTAVVGIIELANGCCELSEIPDTSLKFILCSVYMSFGGLCVTMQTSSVTGEIGIKHYLFGKIIQTAISFLLAVSITPLIFQRNEILILLGLALPVIIVILKTAANKLYSRKKVVEILG